MAIEQQPSNQTSTPTFTAPEGTYRQSTVVLPMTELPLTSPLALNATAATLGISTIPSQSASTGQQQQQATSPGSDSASSSTTDLRSLPPITPTHNTYGPSILPLAWRKGAGSSVEPSVSACGVRWSSLNNNTSVIDSASDPQQGTTTNAGTNLSSSLARTESSGGSAGTSNRTRSARSTDRPNPLVEGTLVSQGIDPPVTSTTGGVGGILGMTALTSYGFLPAASQLDLERQLSLLSVASSSTSNFHTPSSVYKPSKGVSKPKNGIRQTNSSFVIRAQTHSDLKDILTQREKQGMGPPMVVTQKGRTLLWLADAHGTKDPLVRILFASPPSAHDINQLTRSSSTLDVIVGFPTGDILWIDLISLRYSRINKGGAVTPSGITQIRWLPSATHEGLFVTSHVDGTMLIWDREREDGEVNKTWAPRPWRLALTDEEKMDLREARSPEAASPSQAWSSRWLSGLSSPTFGAHPSVVDWDPLRTIILTRPGVNEPHGTDASGSHPFPSMSSHAQPTFSSVASPAIETPASQSSNPYDAAMGLSRGTGSQRRRERSSTLGGGGSAGAGAGTGASGINGAGSDANTASDDAATSKWDKNPIVHWRVSRGKINDFAISPDLGAISVVADDGLLRIIDLTSQTLSASHASYFGAFLSSAWSMDGKLLLATSCDDLVSVYLPRDGLGYMGRTRLLARCQGHDSSVKSVAWDPYRWKDTDRTYRFGSVGEDGKLCLWDFSSKSLGRPRGMTGTQHSTDARGGAGGGGRASMQLGRGHSGLLDRFHSAEESDETIDVYHPAPSRKEIPTLQPIATYQTYVPPAQPSSGTVPQPGIPPGLNSQPATSPLLSVRFSPHALLLHHATGVLQTFLRPSRDGSSVSRLVDVASSTSVEADTGKGGSGGLLNTTAPTKGGLSFGGTLSRGMKWVGGGGGSGSTDGPTAHTRNANTSATLGVSMF